ncbi:hypothetical protein GCM10027275_50450 [Rhabdobacter roseus]|uniref:Uncharacterized protein n=1 Tax=Rhabdobacter roseus TaxID=1655419 RepID=A0A840U459_9BACT|nr:hypothetical protein [Rhabdobacter roseus]MBB5287118.1 hypothetical protein [Rhabdobacter roseus]
MADFEDSPILHKLLQDFTKRVERGLQDAVRREGVVLTGELLHSIRAGSVTQGKGWISAHIYYSDLLRIKDMKVLNYSTIPPLGPLARWVEQVGTGRFAYVPGYPAGVRPATEIETIYRIAAGIQHHLRATPNVQRGYRGIYNETLKYNLIPQFYEDMRAAANVWAAQQFRDAFGFETTINLPTENVNASRIQAAWNARTTKVARQYAS